MTSACTVDAVRDTDRDATYEGDKLEGPRAITFGGKIVVLRIVRVDHIATQSNV